MSDKQGPFDLPPSVTPAMLDEAGEPEDWADYIHTQDGMYVSVEEVESRLAGVQCQMDKLRDKLQAEHQHSTELGKLLDHTRLLLKTAKAERRGQK